MNEQWATFQLKEFQACALATLRVTTIQAGHAIFNHLLNICKTYQVKHLSTICRANYQTPAEQIPTMLSISQATDNHRSTICHQPVKLMSNICHKYVNIRQASVTNLSTIFQQRVRIVSNNISNNIPNICHTYVKYVNKC